MKTNKGPATRLGAKNDFKKGYVANMIPWNRPDYWGNERKYVLDALDSLWISGGDYHQRLTDGLTDWLEMPHGILTSNGTTALHLAMLALELKAGDEIIVPGFCFLAAANIATNMHLKPVFAEVDPRTWLVTAETLERCITPRTRVIVPVHTYGNVCDMNAILELAKRHNICVIEDCAESLFSTYENKQCGTFGHINCFSFQATKTITTGEGGFVVTRDTSFYETMRLYHSHGLAQRGRYDHQIHGFNFRLTNLQAALGLGQFEKRDAIIEARKQMHKLYTGRLAKNEHLTLQVFEEGVEPVLWAFAIELKDHVKLSISDLFMQMLDRGVETRPGFISSSLLSIFEPHRLNVCENLSNRVISLPSYPTLKSSEINQVCDTLLDIIERSIS